MLHYSEEHSLQLSAFKDPLLLQATTLPIEVCTDLSASLVMSSVLREASRVTKLRSLSAVTKMSQRLVHQCAARHQCLPSTHRPPGHRGVQAGALVEGFPAQVLKSKPVRAVNWTACEPHEPVNQSGIGAACGRISAVRLFWGLRCPQTELSHQMQEGIGQ
eukprot:1149495-Pelagomonas_calceolata.AAC.16